MGKSLSALLLNLWASYSVWKVFFRNGLKQYWRSQFVMGTQIQKKWLILTKELFEYSFLLFLLRAYEGKTRTIEVLQEWNVKQSNTEIYLQPTGFAITGWNLALCGEDRWMEHFKRDCCMPNICTELTVAPNVREPGLTLLCKENDTNTARCWNYV